MGNIKDLSGQKYNRLTVTKDSGKRNRRKVLWLCRCECGNTCLAMGYQLKSGEVKSCGCLQAENRRKGSENNSKNKPLISNGKLNKNNRSGYKGVFWNSQKQQWEAKIKVDYKNYHLCFSDDINECVRARKEAEKSILDGSWNR